MNIKKLSIQLFIFAFVVNAYSMQIGYAGLECIAHAYRRLSVSPILHAFFVPSKQKNDAKKVLLGLIYSEQKSIKVSMYRLTDKDIALALKDAYERGVDVQLLVDSGGFRDRNSQIQLLIQCKIPLLTYEKYYSILHNKYLIFENTLDGKRIVWTGSANVTHGGLLRNIENIIVIEDDRIVNVYTKDFNKLQEKLKRKLLEKIAKQESA